MSIYFLGSKKTDKGNEAFEHTLKEEGRHGLRTRAEYPPMCLCVFTCQLFLGGHIIPVQLQLELVAVGRESFRGH